MRTLYTEQIHTKHRPYTRTVRKREKSEKNNIQNYRENQNKQHQQ